MIHAMCAFLRYNVKITVTPLGDSIRWRVAVARSGRPVAVPEHGSGALAGGEKCRPTMPQHRNVASRLHETPSRLQRATLYLEHLGKPQQTRTALVGRGINECIANT